VRAEGQVADSDLDRLGAAKGAGEAEQDRRPVALAVQIPAADARQLDDIGDEQRGGPNAPPEIAPARPGVGKSALWLRQVPFCVHEPEDFEGISLRIVDEDVAEAGQGPEPVGRGGGRLRAPAGVRIPPESMGRSLQSDSHKSDSHSHVVSSFRCRSAAPRCAPARRRDRVGKGADLTGHGRGAGKRGFLEPCAVPPPCRAVGRIRQGNRRAAPSGFPRGGAGGADPCARQGSSPEGRRRFASAASGAQRVEPGPAGETPIVVTVVSTEDTVPGASIGRMLATRRRPRAIRSSCPRCRR